MNNNTYSESLSKNAEKPMLLKDDEWYRQGFMNSIAVMIVIDPDTASFLDANLAAEKYYGYTIEELKQMQLFDINPAAKSKIVAEINEVGSGRHNKPFAVQHRLKSGEIRDVEVYCSLVHIGENKRIISIVVDITDKLKAERESQTSRKMFTLLAEWAKVGTWEWDMVKNTTEDNVIWKTLTGYEGIVNYETWKSLLHPDDVLEQEKIQRECWKGNAETFETEYRLRHNDGEYRWIWVKCKVIYDDAQKPIRLIGLSIDITRRKREEQILLESEMKLKDFAQAIPEVASIIDEDGRYIECFGDNYFAKRGKEIRGCLISEVFAKEDADFLLNEVRQTLDQGRPRYAVYELTFGQEKILIERRMAPMRYLANGKRTVAVVSLNITKQRETEKKLRLAYEFRRRSDYINDVIHEKIREDKELPYAMQSMGIDFNTPFFVMVIVSDEFTDSDKRSISAENCTVQELKDELIGVLSNLPKLMAWDCREGIGILCCTESQNWEECKNYATVINIRLLEHSFNLTNYIGISEVDTGSAAIKKLYRQALNATIAARCQCQTKGEERIVHYREAGIFQFLPEALETEVVIDFVERTIGKIIKYDREKQNNYLATLEELLHHSSVREKADKLQLHPKTILFRQQRIERILGVNLNDDDICLALSIAIKLKKIIKLD